MKRTLAAAVALSAALAVGGIAPAGADFLSPSGQTLYGLTTTNRIVTFTTGFPLLASNSVEVSGLGEGEELIGIDRRPKTGVIYGVGRVGTTGNLYTIDPVSGDATFVATLVGAPTSPTSGSGPAIVLSGTEFGFDFNPLADALRIVSDTGQNLRVIPSNRMPAATPLLTGDTFTDSPLNVGGATATGVSASAYTNNVAIPASTVLFNLDSRRDVLVTQNPPNSGTLVTVGSLRLPIRSVAGFDIVTDDAGVNTGYAALSVGANPYTILARIDLNTGRATATGVAAFPSSLRGLTA